MPNVNIAGSDENVDTFILKLYNLVPKPLTELKYTLKPSPDDDKPGYIYIFIVVVIFTKPFKNIHTNFSILFI